MGAQRQLSEPYYEARLRIVPRERTAMTEAELLLSDLFEGCLDANDYSRIMPFHGVDSRYAKCRSFMQCFYPLGLAELAAGPTIAAFGDSVATLCYLTGKDHSMASGLPIAVVVGEQDDGGDLEDLVEAYEAEQADRRTLKLLCRPDIAAALRSGRLALILSKTMFAREGDGSYSLLYRVLPWRTNRLLEAAGYPTLSREFSKKFGERLLIFGPRAARLGRTSDC